VAFSLNDDYYSCARDRSVKAKLMVRYFYIPAGITTFDDKRNLLSSFVKKCEYWN
jgi:hypothetical protein